MIEEGGRKIMEVEKQNKYSENYIKGLDLVSEELVKLKKKFEEKAEKKHEAYIKKYHSELKQYDYDPEALHNAWGMDWISKYKYKSLLQLLENEPNRLLPEDFALSYIENLLLNCEMDKYIARDDVEKFQELLIQGKNTTYIDWKKHEETYLKGITLVYKKLQQIDKKWGEKAAKKRKNMMKNEYSALEQYDFDRNQIHNAYGYELINLDEHDRLIKLLEQSEKVVELPEEEATKYFRCIWNDCKYEKQIAETKGKQLKIR